MILFASNFRSVMIALTVSISDDSYGAILLLFIAFEVVVLKEVVCD
jgi:hypothetical protein